MSVLPTPIALSGWRRAGEIASDLLIATALIWMVPLALGAAGAIVAFLLKAR